MLAKRAEVAQTRRRFLQTAGLMTLSASTYAIPHVMGSRRRNHRVRPCAIHRISSPLPEPPCPNCRRWQ